MHVYVFYAQALQCVNSLTDCISNESCPLLLPAVLVVPEWQHMLFAEMG